MFKPTVGELLAGVSDGLRQSVLPVLGPGEAQRQLKAALHVLGRLQRSWDLLPPYLIADNDDIRQTLRSIHEALRLSGVAPPASLASLDEISACHSDRESGIPGIQERSLALPAAMNIRLQALLIELDSWLRAPAQGDLPCCTGPRAALDGLYRRMVDRELHSWGTEFEDA